jgi:GntR family transcriptional repressor for pyruvate dehydrogenase complex
MMKKTHTTSSTFRPVSTPRAFEQVCNQIRGQLASGQLKAGDKLPPERELCLRFAVSRSVLREALRSLEIAGVITLKKGGSGGSFIAESNPKRVTQALADMMNLGAMSLSDLTEVRSLIMADAIRLACERATEEDFAAMDANIALTEQLTLARDYEERRSVATDFYHHVAVASRNPALVLVVDSLTGLLRQFFRTPATRPMSMLISSRRAFMKHLRARNASKATQELTTYLAGLHQYMTAPRNAPVDVPMQPPAPGAAPRANRRAKKA